MRIYVAFVDPSGGSSDSMTLAVAHLSILKKAMLDFAQEWRPPFSPEAVVEECAAILKEYKIATVTGDRYAGEWPRERFREHGIAYQVSEKTRSEIYLAFIVLANSGRVRLPSNRRLRAQFSSLERRTSRSGKDVVDHAGGHDDLANSAAGALVLAANVVARRKFFMPTTIDVQIGRPSSSFEVWHDPHKGLGPNDSGDERFWHKIN